MAKERSLLLDQLAKSQDTHILPWHKCLGGS